MDYNELRKRVKELKEKLCLRKEDRETFDYMISFINTMEQKYKFEEKQKFNSLYGTMMSNKTDVTEKFKDMINAFESDFNLAFYYGDNTIFDDLKRLIENKNSRLNKDIQLLQDLSFGIRYGILKIYKVKGE